MAAQISFLAGYQFTINDLAGSGLGFYGSGGFGTSVPVGQQAQNTYITDATGALAGPKVNTVVYAFSTSGTIPTNDTRVLREIPNYLATLNIRFTNDTAVKTQNGVVRIFDRNSIDSVASGVVCYAAQLIHPWNTQTPAGSGDTTWSNLGGSGGVYVINGVPTTYDLPLSLVDSPGTSGFAPSGTATTDVQHDWYLAISPQPLSIGAKTQFALYTSLEYL